MAEYNPSKIIKDGNTYNFRDTTKIPLAGSNQISGSLIPSTDGTVNLGGPSYQWNNAYIKSLTINGVACGDILTHNASEFVDVTSNQTIGGQKIFSNASTGFGKDIYLFATIPYGKNTPPAEASTQYINFSGNTAFQGFANGWISGYIEQTVQTNGGSRCRWLIRSTNEKNASVELLSAGNITAFRPPVDNTMLLGLSSHKWKDCNTYAINGINPGALSLPSTSYTTLDVTNFVLDGNTNNRIVMPYDGWLNIRMASCENYSVRNTLNGITYQVENTNGLVHLTIPVPNGTNMAIYAKCSSIDLRAFTCRGNV